MDEQFYKLLAAIGEMGIRKRTFRSRVYLACAAIVFPAVLVPWALVVHSALELALVIASSLCFSIAELYARARMPRIVEEVARETGFTAQQLQAESKHVDSAM